MPDFLTAVSNEQATTVDIYLSSNTVTYTKRL